MTSTELKSQIDSEITNETAPNSVSTIDVGNNLKDIVDYVDQEIGDLPLTTKTAGLIEANDISPYQELTFNLNSVSTSGVSDKVVLPTTTEIGKEVLVFALNNANSFTVRGNQAGTSVMSLNGVSSQSGSITVATNTSFRFIHLGSGFWKAESI